MVAPAGSELRAQVQAGPLPRHVGIIMDGNGRWAQARGLPRLEGHREGSSSVRAVTTCARELGLEALTLYAFSSQNWARPPTEVLGLMELLRVYLRSEQPALREHGIRLKAIGELARLPGPVRSALEESIEGSKGNRGMTLTLALSYGGREELVRAARALCADVERGKLAAKDVDERALESRLDTADLPPLDLCIRTSGELRLSNFLLWQVAYAEIVVADELWPDFREDAFHRALLAYRSRERRFGKTSAQLGPAGTKERTEK